METPYTGTAIINDNFDNLEIIIPATKNKVAILFLMLWMCGWAMGETFAIRTFINRNNSFNLFILVWLVAWTTAGFFAIRTILWSLIGKEIINVGQGQLTVDKKGLIFYQPKSYDLNEVKDMRVQYEENNNYSFLGNRNNTFGMSDGGTIRFDYGLKTIRFGSGVDEAEAKVIVKKIEEKYPRHQR